MKSSFDVLLIDDDSAVRGVVAEALRLAGYSLLIASGGDVAMALLAQHSFRLVVTDVLMPLVDGFEVIVYLRKHLPDTRILAMSGGGYVGESLSLLRAARCLGAHGTIEKPFDVDPFLGAVSALLAGVPITGMAALPMKNL